MKVLFITNMYPVPDFIYFGIHVKEQIEALEATGDVEKTVYFINGRARKFNYLKSIFELNALLKKEKFDVIHIHYGLSALFLLFLRPTAPVVITLHSGELFQKQRYLNHLVQKNITLSVLRKAKKVIVLNDTMIALLTKHREKLLKLPCGIDLRYFREIQVQKSAQKLYVGFPGNRARVEKNYPLFEQIISSLRTTHDIEVIEFHNLTREEVVRQLNRIDLLLMTSLIEGSPQIIKEAMACNKPIVSTSVGDVEDLLQGVQNCAVVGTFRADDFMAPVTRILELPAERRKSDGRDRLVAMGLDAGNVAGTILHLYREIA